jgi:hypothetical protein
MGNAAVGGTECTNNLRAEVGGGRRKTDPHPAWAWRLATVETEHRSDLFFGFLRFFSGVAPYLRGRKSGGISCTQFGRWGMLLSSGLCLICKRGGT